MSSADLQPGLTDTRVAAPQASAYDPPTATAGHAGEFVGLAIPPPLPGDAKSGDGDAMQGNVVEAMHGEAPPMGGDAGLVCDENDETKDRRKLLASAPAWLVSSIVHMLLMIVLGLWILAPEIDNQVRIILATGEGDPDVEDLNPIKIADDPIDKLTEPSPPLEDLPEVPDPLQLPAAPLPRLDLSGVGASADIKRPNVTRMLSGRTPGMKRAYLTLYGGTPETEAAVLEGLKWLARTQQRTSGRWKLSSVSNNRNEAAATSMALLAFIGAGDTDRKGRFQKNVARGFKALLKLQGEDGKFSHGKASYNHALYTHALCTITLCEMYALTGDSQYLLPAQNAVAYAVAAQAPEGGWRYYPGKGSDLSVTGWMLMALQSARMAGLEVPEKTLAGVEGFLDKVERSAGDYYVYESRENSGTTPALTSAGLLSRQYLGAKRDNPTILRALDRLLDDYPLMYESDDQTTKHDVYYWYYVAQVAHHVGGKRWKKWNDVMRVEVPKHQTTSGRHKGSWNPEPDRWGMIGRHYVTCLSIYMLEVYYRHLPLYSLDRE